MASLATNEIVFKPEQSLGDMISTFVRKSTKQQRRKQLADEEPCKIRNSGSCRCCRHGEVGYWDNESTTDSFLELSSEVLPVEMYGLENKDVIPTEVEENMSENGNLWKDDVRRKCEKLTQRLESKLRSTSEQHGLSLKFSSDLPETIAKKIVDTASQEPCGLRGCCINLRLLHEDIADVLMTSQTKDCVHSDARAEKCASWPTAPHDSNGMEMNSAETRPSLDFRILPNLDATLTEAFNPDTSTDSGFSESPHTRTRVQRRLQHSLSSSAIPVLPSLSAASRLQVPCANLGRLELCDSDSVPTFEVYVYLAPATSWSWWMRKLFSSSLQLGRNDANRRTTVAKNSKAITLMPDFTIVKKKLYRTRSNSLEVIRCPVVSK